MRITVLLLVLFACGTEPLEQRSEADLENSNCGIDAETGLCTCVGSPIVFDLNGDGIHLTGTDEGVVFALRGSQPALWSWTAANSDDAWLVYDANENGTIDNGAEMFGDSTLQATSPSPNGFLALAYYDAPERGGNGDGQIDSNDAIYSKLRLWRDIDHDGVSAPAELDDLTKAHVWSVSLAYSPFRFTDAHGNQFRVQGSTVADAPVSPTIYDVWLVRYQPTLTEGSGSGATQDYTQYTCTAWGYYTTGCDTGQSCTVPCDTIYIQSDPIVTDGRGHLARLVARRSSDPDKITAMRRAQNIVSEATNPIGGSSVCYRWFYPVPDPYSELPYDYDANDAIVLPRAKCRSRIVRQGPEGGGGGGGAPSCP